MDIISHGLWAAAAAKTANKTKKIQKPLNLWRAGLWGMFPDLFAFTVPFIWLIGGLLLKEVSLSDLPKADETEPAPTDRLPIFRLASMLYSVSHSFIIFFPVFILVWLIWRRPAWEMGGWFLHILFDIPTHSYKFYPTPFLWPISNWKFHHGISWATPWFMILNYSALAVVFLLLRRKRLRR